MPRHSKTLIVALNEKERQEREIYIFYEFIYFYMHMTMRRALEYLTESQMQKLQSYLDTLLTSVAIDSYFAHWPDDMKERLTRDFCHKLEQAKLEYIEVEKAAAVPFESLFMKLGSNVARLVAEENKDTAVMDSVSEFAFHEWARRQLDDLIVEVREGSPEPNY